MTGDKNDVVRILRQILNCSIAHRTIPKQECMVELAKLPQTLCSENIETVNISGSYTIKSTPDNKLVDQYRKVAPHDHSLSLHDFVTSVLKNKAEPNKTIIPHYVGANGHPVYPPIREYARATLLVHKPWAATSPPYLNEEEWIEQFKAFIASPQCPKSIVLEYIRVKERYESKRPTEAVATEECYDWEAQTDVDQDTKDMLGIITNHSRPSDPYYTIGDYTFELGLNYDWSTRVIVSNKKANSVPVSSISPELLSIMFFSNCHQFFKSVKKVNSVPVS